MLPTRDCFDIIYIYISPHFLVKIQQPNSGRIKPDMFLYLHFKPGLVLTLIIIPTERNTTTTKANVEAEERIFRLFC